MIGDFGSFPEEVDVSGTDRQGNPKHGTEIHLSRKGNDLVRRLRDTAAQWAVTWNPPVKALFARLRADGQEDNLCLGHCLAKLLRQVFALWSKDCNFDPAFETPPTAAAESAANESVPNKSVPSELPVCEAKTFVGHPAQNKGTPQASKGGAPLEQGR